MEVVTLNPFVEFWHQSWWCVALQVVAYQWGNDIKELLPGPDLITGADIVYQAEHFAALIKTLQALAAPHTLIYLAYKLRGKAVEKTL